MLTAEIAQKINNFVAAKPRTIQEIAQLLQKNWRTAESYIEKISLEQGTLRTRTFRGGTRGALKIVYWNLIDQNQSTFQEMLFHKITNAKHKNDFSPFDIYQYIDEDKRACFLENQENNLNVKQDLISTIASAEKQVLIFSGDLSWSQAHQNKIPLLEAFKRLANKKVSVKILAKVDLNSLQNVEKMNQINHVCGQEFIEIRHCQQPLRALIIDDRVVQIKEKYFFKSTSAENYLFYSINDQNWIHWLQKLFWHSFSTSLTATKRIKDLESIKQI